MLTHFAFWILLVVSTIDCRKFDNPVIRNLNTPDPGVLKYNGMYYSVTTTNNNDPEKFPIHVSKDLQNWELVTYVLNAGNFPSYSNKDQWTWAPELHQVVVTAAIATNITGPYTPIQDFLVPNCWDGTLLNDEGNVTLFWTEGAIYGRTMNPDGLSFPNNTEKQKLIEVDLPWENGFLEAPWVQKRGDYYYLFYSGAGLGCEFYAVGVARSRNTLGPYEKLGDPILVPTDDFKLTGHCSVVRDIVETDYVIMYHGYPVNQVCDPNPRLMMATSLRWTNDGWPYVDYN